MFETKSALAHKTRVSGNWEVDLEQFGGQVKGAKCGCEYSLRPDLFPFEKRWTLDYSRQSMEDRGSLRPEGAVSGG